MAARHKREIVMTVATRLLYQIPGGDRWHLARDTDTGRVFVRHEANLSSGGRVSDVDIGAFLGAGGLGPEQQELLRLIGGLVMVSEPADSAEPAAHPS